MFKVGDVVRHKASGERFVVVSLDDTYRVLCDSGSKRDSFRWIGVVSLEPAPPFRDAEYSRSVVDGIEGSRCVSPVTAELGWYVSEDGKIKRVVKDDKAWNLSKEKDRG